ncbi:MAG: CBS domain-containing protein [Methylobacter sp.]|uniref:CBS domain-containing protein n=1 Tax=Methylobacter sp. TaxID=2051955 RepID=UPI00272F7D48|nr:CBS domain-containing protein [Methylobacter sp.]MDP1665749.1 CBS domain-containing protein [Methylobacter sp.]MDP1969828.1 CBS domain-containing protein [Methylobacter sp.]
MIVADIMTANPVKVNMDTELLVIKDIFDHVYFHHLLVENEADKTIAGVISDRDLLSALSPYIHTAAETLRDQETLKKRAHQIMSRQIDTVTPTTDCNIAVQKMLDADVSCLPVVGDDNVILGIVTWKDFLIHYLKQQSPENYKYLVMKHDWRNDRNQ